jgi:N-acylneuraminate cytidylyltransferase
MESIRPLVVIPARGGSKGVPRKNVKLLAGKPLIHYTIEAARKVFDDEFICLSTDDVEIKEIAEQTGLKVLFLRPPELSKDSSSSRDLLLHAINFQESELGYFPNTIILLQPTSPFRSSDHITQALSMFTLALDMVVSVKMSKANPYFNLFEKNTAGYLQKCKVGTFLRRQDAPQVWEYNGAIYVINADSLKNEAISDFPKVKEYVMDEYSSVDIDTPFDWELSDWMMSKSIKGE